VTTHSADAIASIPKTRGLGEDIQVYPLFTKISTFREGGFARSRSKGTRIYKVLEFTDNPFRLTLKTYGETARGHWVPSARPRVTTFYFQQDCFYEPVKYASLAARQHCIRKNLRAKHERIASKAKH
jgi:hypothetical protein